ncbi:hypothetical protein ACK3TF_002400 [Chlorella vulgaris]
MCCVPRLGPAPMQLVPVFEQILKPSRPEGRQGETALSPLDQVNVITATARSWGFPGSRLVVAALEAALQATIDDLPFLAGRISKMKGLSLGSLSIVHTGAGVVFSMQSSDDVAVAAMGPASWPHPCITISSPAVPFYIPPMNGQRILAGSDPLMRVQVTRLSDGDILAISISHVITDGCRWPALTAHLAARYREHASGVPADPSHLLQPTDRRLMSSADMAVQLGCQEGAWRSHRPAVAGSLSGYWNLGKLLLGNAWQQMELQMLYIPAAQVAALKQLATEGNPVAAVTTGDAVQAACALLLHAALDLPLLPIKPHSMAALVQQATPPGYTGNAAYMLRVNLPPGTQQPAPGDGFGALRQLAGAVRAATAAFRASPEAGLRELRDAEALVAAPLGSMLSFLAQARMPLLTCTTNYVPQQQDIDLGLGPSTYQLGMTMPRAKDMAVIRPACHPYSPGLFAQLCLQPHQAARLRCLPLLAQLLPQATWVGAAA